jgi:NitT/TauT family transport system substrate-binding protein
MLGKSVFRFVTAPVLVLVFTGAGCWPGGDRDKKIHLAYLQSDLHHLPVFVALEKEFYKEAGLDVEIAGVFKAGPEEMSAFGAGGLDAGYVGQAPATVAVGNRVAWVKALAQVNTEGSALVVRKDSPIKTLADLRGKVVVIPGHSTIQDFLLRKALVQAGVDFNEATIITLKPPEMIAALQTKQIDAFIAWEPFPAKAVTSGVGRVLVHSHEIWPGHPCCVLVGDSHFLEKSPQEAEALVCVHLKAIDYIEKNPAEAVAIGVKYTGMDEQTVKEALTNITFDPQLRLEAARDYVDFLSELTYIEDVDPAELSGNFFAPGFLEGCLSKSQGRSPL